MVRVGSAPGRSLERNKKPRSSVSYGAVVEKWIGISIRAKLAPVRTLFGIILSSLLAGCAAPRPIQPTAYQKAQWTCEHQTYAQTPPGLIAIALYHDCMRAHGWSK